MVELTSEIKTSLNSALNKLTGHKRRQYSAELCEMFFKDSARKMERSLKVGRAIIELGQHERRTGIKYLDAYSLRGAKKKKSLMSI